MSSRDLISPRLVSPRISGAVIPGEASKSVAALTAGAYTLTAVDLQRGYCTWDPAGADRALTLPAVAVLATVLKAVGSEIKLSIYNSADADEVGTVTTVTGTTLLQGPGKLPYPAKFAPGETVTLLYRRIGASTYTCEVTNNYQPSETAITAAGDTALTRAQVRTGTIEYDPAGSHRAPTLPIATAMVAGLLGADGNEWELCIKNTADAAENTTITTAAGLTITLGDGSSDAVVGEGEAAYVRFKRTSATTVDVRIDVY